MDLKSILDFGAKVGKIALKNVVPGAGIVIDAVNELLPDDKKLPATATGGDLQSAVNSLPAQQRGQLMAKEFDVQIAEIEGFTNIVTALAGADAAGASTRPKIALMMAWLLTFAVSIFIGVWAISIGFDKTQTLDKLNASWPMVLSVLGPIIALLRAYFGLRTKEKQTRYAMGSPGLKNTGFLTDLISAFKKR